MLKNKSPGLPRITFHFSPITVHTQPEANLVSILIASTTDVVHARTNAPFSSTGQVSEV
jgi:hypothetical protein